MLHIINIIHQVSSQLQTLTIKNKKIYSYYNNVSAINTLQMINTYTIQMIKY